VIHTFSKNIGNIEVHETPDFKEVRDFMANSPRGIAN